MLDVVDLHVVLAPALDKDRSGDIPDFQLAEGALDRFGDFPAFPAGAIDFPIRFLRHIYGTTGRGDARQNVAE
ncbi:MAG: hypothetical protein V3T35_10710 [Spirochaetia bacterium]